MKLFPGCMAVAAGVLLAAAPVIAIFMAFQRFFIQGLTQGSVKG